MIGGSKDYGSPDHASNVLSMNWGTAITIDQHLRQTLNRYAVDMRIFSPVRTVQTNLEPLLQRWANGFAVAIESSGSFSKGTAVHGGTDIDIFISLTSALHLPLRDIYELLFTFLNDNGFVPRRQNVSIGISSGGYSVDVTPGRRQDQFGNYHSLYSNRTGTWLQTNIREHQRYVANSGRVDEIRLMKIWRNRFGLDWPSFYLELFAIDALRGAGQGALAANIPTIFRAVNENIASRRLIDPANTNNVVSDTLDAAGKAALSRAAATALQSPWNVVFQ